MGCVGLGLYCTAMLLSSPLEDQDTDHGGTVNGKKFLTKQESIKQVLDELKRELRKNFGPELQRNPDDGLFEKESFVKIHVLMYKYKKFGHDMIVDANNRERLSILAKIEQIQ